MKPFSVKTCVALGALLGLALPLMAQAQGTDNGPVYRRYDQVQADQNREAYEQGRADQARSDANHSDADGRPGPDGRRYDGYCYERKAQASTSGAILGAVAGGLIGNGASNRWDRGGNTVAGAAIGAVLGASVGKNSVSCYGGDYYAYDSGYYAPPPPPEGYTTVYFYDRPAYGYYEHIYAGPRYARPYYYGRAYGYGPVRRHGRW